MLSSKIGQSGKNLNCHGEQLKSNFHYEDQIKLSLRGLKGRSNLIEKSRDGHASLA